MMVHNILFVVLLSSMVNYALGTCSNHGNASCSSLANATFSEDFVSVKIKFSLSIKPAGPFNGCHSIFENVTTAKLGNIPICSFTEHNIMNVFPDNFGSIKAGDLLEFQTNSIIDGNGTTVNIGSVLLQSERSQELKPLPLIAKYGYPSECNLDTFYISADMSYYSGYTQFSRYNWRLEGLTINPTAAVLNASEYLANQAANVSEIIITNLVSSANRSINLNITNIFESTGNTVISLAQESKPLARIQGIRTITMSQNAALYLHADLSISKCGTPLKEATYKWSVVKASVPENSLLEKTINGKSLYLKPNLLSRNTTYDVTVNITYVMNDNMTGYSTDTISIHVKKIQLVAAIEGGDRDIGKNQTLILNGKEATGVKGVLGVMWQCTDLSTGMPCKTNQGVPIEFGNSTSLIVAMEDGNFTIGNRYQFTLKISVDSETSYSSIIVTIKEFPTPLISVTSLRQFHSKYDDIVLRGMIYANAVNTIMQCSWKIFEYSDNRVVLESQIRNLTTDQTSGSIPYISMYRIPRDTLKSGYRYQVDLQVTAEGRNIKHSKSLTITVPPRFAHLVSEPTHGIAFNTTFRLRSYGWIAHNNRKPLLYRFGYKAGSQIRLLSGWQSTNVLGATLLPSGDPQNGNKLTIFAEVRDNYGLIVKKEATAIVIAQESNNYESLFKYYQERVIEKDHASMSTAIIGIVNSGLSNEAKSPYVETYLNAIESATYTSDLISLFIDTMDGLVTLNNSGDLLSQQSKEIISRMVVKFSKELETSATYPKKTQLQSLLSIFDGMITQPKQLPSNSTGILTASFHNTSMKILELACRSSLFENPLNISTSMISVSSGIEDFSKDFSSSPHFSVSQPYRRKYIEDNCMGENYIKCVGICWSVAAYSKKEHFLMDEDVGNTLTKIHKAKLIDLDTMREVSFSTNGKDFLFKLPIAEQYNSTNETVKCVMYDPITLRWNEDYCHSEITQESSGSRIANCACSRMYAVAGIKAVKPSILPSATLTTSSTWQNTTSSTWQNTTSSAWQNTTSSTWQNTTSSTWQNTTSSTWQITTSSTWQITTSSISIVAATPDPSSIITIVLDANCTKYTSDDTVKSYFIGNLTVSLADQLRISKSRIKIWSITCGSLIVNLTIANRDGSQASEPAKADAMVLLQNMLSTGLMRVSLSDGSLLAAVAPGVQIRTTPIPTTVITTRPPVPNMSTNWMPMMVSFIAILIVVIATSAFVAWLHGRYYKNKRYTDINCNRKKPEVKESIETMSKSKRIQQLHKIMDESIENAEVPSIITPAAMSLKRTKRKMRITPLNSRTSFHNSSTLSSRTTLEYSARDLPRLALDETSSESEAETSFAEANPRPKSTKSTKSRGASAKPVKNTNQGMELRADEPNKDYLSPSRAVNNYSANGRYSRQSSSSSSD